MVEKRKNSSFLLYEVSEIGNVGSSSTARVANEDNSLKMYCLREVIEWVQYIIVFPGGGNLFCLHGKEDQNTSAGCIITVTILLRQ